MPTSRPRHTITETDDIARALDAAARRWPDDGATRSQLLVRLVREGLRAIEDRPHEDAARRRAAVERTRGALTGVYPEGYLSRLRDEWPA
jgi:hypothetical protein